MRVKLRTKDNHEYVFDNVSSFIETENKYILKLTDKTEKHYATCDVQYIEVKRNSSKHKAVTA